MSTRLEHAQLSADGEPTPDETGGESQPSWVTVMTREMVVKVTDRNFLLSTALTLLIMVGIFAVQGFLSQRDDTVSVAVTGNHSQRVAHQAGTLARNGENAFELTVRRYDSTERVKQAVSDGDADAGLIHTSNGWRLVGKTDKETGLATYVRQAVEHRVLQRNAAQEGTTAAALTAGSDVPYTLMEKDNHTTFSLIVGFVIAMLFYMAALGYGMLIATSVVAEKQSRVVEILVSAVRVRHLLFGKIIGNTLLALGQIALLTLVGLVGITFTGYESLLPVVASVAGWFVAFFIVGFFALACIWAVAGSLATRHEDLQSTTAPLTMFMVIVLLASLSLSGTGQVVASYIPVMSTVVMPMRIVAGTAAWWEPVLALLATLVFTTGAVLMCERLYRRSVLQTQGRMSYRQALAAHE